MWWTEGDYWKVCFDVPLANLLERKGKFSEWLLCFQKQEVTSTELPALLTLSWSFWSTS